MLKKLSKNNAKYWTGKEFSKEHREKISKSNKNYYLNGGINPMKGKHHSEEVKRKISLKNKNKIVSKETRENISKAVSGENNGFYGKCHSDKTRKKISEANKGKECSEITRKKLSEASKGKKCLQKTREKIGKANKGKIRSKEVKENISRFLTGKHRSKETREKIGRSIRGKKHWNWKGGISSLSEKIRSSIKYKEWVREVLKQNDYVCQKYKIRSKQKNPVILVAHHVKNFALIIKENNIKTLEHAFSCWELWDVNNGITLSEKAHKEFHKIYGTKNNTKEQLEEFIDRKLII